MAGGGDEKSCAPGYSSAPEAQPSEAEFGDPRRTRQRRRIADVARQLGKVVALGLLAIIVLREAL